MGDQLVDDPSRQADDVVVVRIGPNGGDLTGPT
ncbi:hypothetical protein HD596_000777 [Nonomuraea jabiensis]|uniref:Uncharacterized protein n=1 Tax=Nonomuraea jabiensis TaxID=882448 RepID=A0A7W9FYU5_9ACTN|nr:hypothetical protein [Nonomuraea jabiensis]